TEPIVVTGSPAFAGDDRWPSLHPRRRTEAIGERTERGKLVGFEFALVVAADENLEHDAAVDIEEQDRRRQPAHEGPLDEGDGGAALVPQMAVEALAAGHVVI